MPNLAPPGHAQVGPGQGQNGTRSGQVEDPGRARGMCTRVKAVQAKVATDRDQVGPGRARSRGQVEPD